MMTFKKYFEDISLYAKRPNQDEPSHIGDIDNDFYANVLSRYIKLGSSDSITARKIIEGRLNAANALKDTNLDIFQMFISDLEIDVLDKNKFNKCQEVFLNTIQNNASISIDDLITTAFSPLKPPSQSEYYSKAWTALPHAPRHGAPGDGEAFLSFFCNGVKPKKGDIKIESHDIELKGPQGRMYKNKTELGLADEQALQLLNQPDGIGKYIAAISGTQEYEQQIIDLINSSQGITDQVNTDFQYMQQRGKLRPGNLFIQIGGIAQLYAYKQSQKFHSIVFFSPGVGNSVLQGVLIPATIGELYNILANIPSRVVFSRAADGGGWKARLR